MGNIPDMSYARVVFSQISYSLFFPFGKKYINLYPNLNNDIYADIVLSPNPEKIEFLIAFMILNQNPIINKFKLIDFPNIDASIKWIDVDLDNFQMKVFPTNSDDLVMVFQPLTLIYSTKIQTQELTQEEMQFLMMSNYIDNELFLTKTYSPNKKIVVLNDNISLSKIDYILKQHYFEKVYYLNVESFTNCIASPMLKTNLQDQFNQKIYEGVVIIDKLFEFQFYSDIFKNFYNLPLTYAVVQNLPDWLSFDSNNLRFSGIPIFSDRNQDYNITLLVSNGFHMINDSFVIKVRYYEPILIKPLQEQFKSNPQVEIETTYFFSKNSFYDPNNETLTYKCVLNGYALPSWITFDYTNFLLMINPDNSAFMKSYTLNITAFNKFFNCTDSFKFTVQPSWIYILTLFSQISAVFLGIIGYFKYRSSIYNFLFKNYYKYPQETLIVNTYYEKQIYFIAEDLEIGFKLWSIVKSKYSNYNDDLLLKVDFKHIFSNELKNAYDALMVRKKIKNIDVSMTSLEPDGTVFVVCECILSHYLLSKASPTYKVYYNMKYRMLHDFSRTWYLKFVSFIKENRNFKTQKFPKIKINKETLKNEIKNSIKLLKYKENLISFTIISGMLKADALGIPKEKRNFYNRLEYSRGESCFLNILDINEIKFRRVLSGNKIEMEINSNKKLPSWMDYQIKNGILNLYGTPQFYDIGKLNFSIIDKQGVIVRSQNIEIKLNENINKGTYCHNEEIEKMINIELVEENSAKDKVAFLKQ